VSVSADTLTTAAWLFASTFALVFALGLQSLNVNGGHYRAAFITSLGIGASNLVLFKMAPDASGIEIVAYLAGGPLGIVSAMRAHPYIVRLYRRQKGTTS
jgi:hypothetical protein